MPVQTVKTGTSDPLDLLYNKELKRLAADPGHSERLAAPQASVRRTSPLCGSRIEIDLALEGGRVAAYGQTVKACTLGQASAGIMGRHVIGARGAELRAMRRAVQAMLKEGRDLPDDAWAELRLLVPARDFRSRHGSILLPFDAVVEALDRIEGEPSA